MGLHRFAKPVPVKGTVPLRSQGLKQFRWKAIGGVEFAGILPANQATTGRLDRIEQFFDPGQAAVDCRQKGLFFSLDHSADPFDGISQFGIAAGHLGRHCRRQLVQEWLPHAHLPAVEHGPSKQSLDDVLLFVITWQHILVNGKAAGPHMVGDAANSAAVIIIWQIPPLAGFCHGLDQWQQDVNMKVAVDPLQHGGGSLEAHAGVDIPARQRFEILRRIANAVELREDEVPDLDIAAIGHPVEDFATGPADPVRPLRGCTGRPEIVILAHPGDPVGRHPDLVRPDAVSLVVIVVNGD